MMKKLNDNLRYIQLAFNNTTYEVRSVLPQIPKDRRIIIEAGTPYIKREGMPGVRLIKNLWGGMVVADLKTSDGAEEEVLLAYQAGADAVTCLGSAPTETLDFFNATCKQYGVFSMIDMLGVKNPLKKLLPLKNKPNFVVIHKGRDEEENPRSTIRYKDINKVRSKYDVFITVGGGLTEKNVRSAYFNGANVAILNIIDSSDPNAGLLNSSNFGVLITTILKELGA